MAEPETAATADQVYTPCSRAFLVYYVAMFICFAGPRINPAVGMPTWLGDILGLILVAAVVYMRRGQEYRITSRGVSKLVRWPSPRQQEIAWADLGEVLVRRGLTQSLLRVGNLLLRDKSGGQSLFWFGLAHPQEVKDAIERRRP